MGTDSTKSVFDAIAGDATAATRVAEGDFTAYADADLTDAERALLTAAAGELASAEVEGFYLKLDPVGNADGYLKLGDISPSGAVGRLAAYIKIEG